VNAGDTGFVSGLIMAGSALGALAVRFGPVLVRLVRPETPRPPPTPTIMSIPESGQRPPYQRSYSPGQIAAVAADQIVERQREDRALANQIQQTALLEAIKELLEKELSELKLLVANWGERNRRETARTRHMLNTSIQAVHLAVANGTNQPRPRFPSRSEIDIDEDSIG
jgi:hypothetical protein